MIVCKKEKFIEVTPDPGMVLTDGNEYFEGLCCPFGVNIADVYQEITIEQYEELQNKLNLEDKDNGSDNNWTNN